ncbi:hypothetical protein [Cupriavidus sp. DL-D2]|uniref:hypothetical protein n=1 Tax=Cupriavidus sp. DL-D2 TaxID=3144974 RepID=UPI0032145872
MGRILVNSGGAWTPAKRILVKDAGAWKEAKKVFINDNGTWRRIFAQEPRVVLTAARFDWVMVDAPNYHHWTTYGWNLPTNWYPGSSAVPYNVTQTGSGGISPGAVGAAVLTGFGQRVQVSTGNTLEFEFQFDRKFTDFTGITLKGIYVPKATITTIFGIFNSEIADTYRVWRFGASAAPTLSIALGEVVPITFNGVTL